MALVSYDAAGNLLQDGTGTGAHTYSWDAEGRLLTVDGGTEAYAYNVLGQRVQKRVSGVYSNSAHDAFGRLIYHDTGTSQSQIFQWLDNKMIGYYTTWERYAHTNALGSVTALTDVNGNLYQEEQFFPWGQQWTGSIEDDHFAGMDKHDTETGLDPTQFRMFSSNQSRWLSPDPLAGDVSNPQSLNRYAYVLNNPATLTDPLGLTNVKILDPSTCDGIACGGNGVDTNPADLGCAYVGSSGGQAQCQQAAGLWDNGEPITPGVSGGGGGFGGGGGGLGSSPLSGDFGPMGMPGGGGSGMPCDFGTCGGGLVNGFQAADAAVQATPWIFRVTSLWPYLLAGLEAVGPYAGPAAVIGSTIFMTGDAVPHAKPKGRSAEDVERNCSPVGPPVSEPATGIRYKGGTSVEQEFICSDGPYTVHWIERGGKIIHGPHARPGFPTGGGD